MNFALTATFLILAFGSVFALILFAYLFLAFIYYLGVAGLIVMVPTFLVVFFLCTMSK